MRYSGSPLTLALDEAVDVALVGTKAARLGALRRAGFPVPDGVVLTTVAAGHPGWIEALRPAVAALGAATLAVRSSAVAEDRDEASFAGVYETVLDVLPARLEAAVRTCWAAAGSDRVKEYTSTTGAAARPGMAVLVQEMLAPQASGVAMSADPVTGRRDAVVVSAVRGQAEPLVGGRAEADEWRVADGRARCTRSPQRAIGEAQALTLAALVRRIEDLAGLPQDVEWAIVDGRILILQARAMTGLPADVDWSAPLPGGWMRNFRLGEWLPEPVTPLFDTWFLTRLEARFASEQARDAGFLTPPPLHVVVNGWYFHSPFGSASPRIMVAGLLRRPSFALGSIALRASPDISDRLIASAFTQRWRDVVLPRYEATIDDGLSRIGTAGRQELMLLVEELAARAGEYTWSMVMVAGFAWKVETVLARFCDRHLEAVLEDGYQPLLCGLTDAPLAPPAHAVHSIDWAHPTLGETARRTPGDGRLLERRQRLDADRAALEAACRSELGGRRRRRFERLLALAQRYGRLREEQAASFTLGWPLLRRAVLRLGVDAAAQGHVRSPEDIFFLTRTELVDGGDCSAEVARRRQAWERQRRLSPPLVIGTLPGFIRHMVVEAVESMRPAGPPSPVEAIVGLPASPGRATGPARVVRDAADHDHVQAGDVLVVATMAPAWTHLFARVAAVVSDGGNLAAHASMIAREYGIPAVVATGEATRRLHDGDVVVVDGALGIVVPVDS